mmetsp:Transcript_16505/g.38161  ORF Transcript_16505/g.38161 Transcript_16505/m.38161 type:complete len:91 (-) Transcript_16505:29-301(-)
MIANRLAVTLWYVLVIQQQQQQQQASQSRHRLLPGLGRSSSLNPKTGMASRFDILRVRSFVASRTAISTGAFPERGPDTNVYVYSYIFLN